jgi:hypothetical protein
LEGYSVYGMCLYNGNLDYLVAMHDNSNEIRVIRLSYDKGREIANILDYKVVDKEESLKLTGNIYVDCANTGTFHDVNTYTIGIMGTYFHNNSISSFYFGKFSTRYNLTEYIIKSEDPTIMEIPRRVRVDPDN